MYTDKKGLFRISGKVSSALCIAFTVCLTLHFICLLWLALLPDKLSFIFEHFQIWRLFTNEMYPYTRALAELCPSIVSYSFAVFFSKIVCEIFRSLERGGEVPIDKVRKSAIASIACALVVPAVHNVAFDTLVTTQFSRMGIDLGLLVFGLALLVISHGFSKPAADNTGVSDEK